MTSWNGWDTNPIRYQPLPGKEVKDDGTVLGVPEWREDIRLSNTNKTQVRDGLENLRVYDPQANDTMKMVLEQLKAMNRHLEIITEAEVNDWD